MSVWSSGDCDNNIVDSQITKNFLLLATKFCFKFFGGIFNI